MMVVISLRSITVSQSQTPSLTQHAMLIAWGQYLHCLGLIQKVEAVPLHQKTVLHRPQTKVLEFLAGMLSGLPHLKDLSCAAHPLDQDREAARAWGQPAWADQSGVSRTMTTLTMDEAMSLLLMSRKFLEQAALPDGDVAVRAAMKLESILPSKIQEHVGPLLEGLEVVPTPGPDKAIT